MSRQNWLRVVSFGAVLAIAALLTGLFWSSSDGDSAAPKKEEPAPTTTTTAPPPAAPTGIPSSVLPQVDGQATPVGKEGDSAMGSLRNLGLADTPADKWSTDSKSAVIERAQKEPLFAVTIAEVNGDKAAFMAATHGLDGLYNQDGWTSDGKAFVEQLVKELNDNWQTLGSLPNKGKVRLFMAKAEKSSTHFVRDLPLNVGSVAIFKGNCGEFAVDAHGNIYVLCDCGKFSRKPAPKKDTPPPGTPPTTTPGMITVCRPSLQKVITIREDQRLPEDVSSASGKCTPPVTVPPPPTVATLPPAGTAPTQGGSGTGAPPSGVTPPPSGTPGTTPSTTLLPPIRVEY